MALPPASPSPRSVLGARIRQRRRELGLTQADLARRVGISASYMNLIELDKRRIAGTRLHRISEVLDLSLERLDGTAERRLFDELLEVANTGPLRPLGIEVERTGELIGRFPGWARALAAVTRAERAATARARALSNRLSNDPFLGERVHGMLTRIASIRSAVEILADYDDIPPARRRRFTEIILEESRVLSDLGEALAVYLERAEEEASILTPRDEVDALFDAHGSRFALLETAIDPARREAAIEAVLDGAQGLETSAARLRARAALARYGEAASALPMVAFAQRAQALRYDIEDLARAYGVGVETVCRRLTALPPAPDTPRFAYVQANAAGTIVELLGDAGVAIPRHAPPCPLWVLFRTQQSPEVAMRQHALLPNGTRHVFVARARATGPAGFGRPRHYVSDMIVMSEEDAAATVYAAESDIRPEEVGPSCRMCPRRNCPHRVEDPLAA